MNLSSGSETAPMRSRIMLHQSSIAAQLQDGRMLGHHPVPNHLPSMPEKRKCRKIDQRQLVIDSIFKS